LGINKAEQLYVDATIDASITDVLILIPNISSENKFMISSKPDFSWEIFKSNKQFNFKNQLKQEEQEYKNTNDKDEEVIKAFKGVFDMQDNLM